MVEFFILWRRFCCWSLLEINLFFGCNMEIMSGVVVFFVVGFVGEIICVRCFL